MNPVIDSNIPDPGALALSDGSGYVVVSTSNYAEFGIGIVTKQTHLYSQNHFVHSRRFDTSLYITFYLHFLKDMRQIFFIL